MRRIPALCVIAAAAFGVTASQSIGSSGGPYDSVTGAGVRGSVPSPTVPAIHFRVSAHDGPQGVFGTYTSQSAIDIVDFKGDVTCLSVSGNRAMVGGVVRKGGVQPLGTFFVGFIDHPSPTPDQVTLTALSLGTPPTDCSEGLFLFDEPIVFTLLSGNVEVNDAPS